MSSSCENNKKIYIEKDFFDHIVKQLLIKIKYLEKKVDKIDADNGSVDCLYRKMDELLIQMRKSYHFGKEEDYEYESE